MPIVTTGIQVAPISSQNKWTRQFRMQAEGATQTYTITSPLTLELDIQRGLYQSVTYGTFTIYNLGTAARSELYLDQNDWLTSPRALMLQAGYLSWISAYGPPNLQSFPTIFHGQLFQAYSTRSGPSWITKMHGWDGGWDKANAVVNLSFDKSVPFNQAGTPGGQLQRIAASLTNVSVGYISPQIQASTYRGGAYSGKPWDILCELARGADADVFIDLGKLYMVPTGQAVPGLTGGLSTISADTGLLNTPIKQQFRVSFDMLFEPRLLIGQSVNLVSQEPENNGTFVVQGLAHRGTISDGVSGDLVTTVTLWNQNASLAGAQS